MTIRWIKKASDPFRTSAEGPLTCAFAIQASPQCESDARWVLPRMLPDRRQPPRDLCRGVLELCAPVLQGKCMACLDEGVCDRSTA